jgi:nucleoside-diphosphate-sugar epimerase
MGQTVLVTGATGFTGGHLARRLIADGQTVRLLVRRPVAEFASAESVIGDVRDKDAVRQAMQGIDTVYHIAALYRQTNVSDQEMRDINACGTQNLLEAATEAGIRRFVHCSTVGVHGDCKDIPTTEDSPYNPGDIYQATKLEGEEIAQRFRDRLPVVIFRPAGIYGPGDLRFRKLFKGIKTGRFAMIGSGETLYQMVYIDDLVDGILLCGSQPDAVGRIYILAGHETVTLNTLVELIADVLHVPTPRLHIPLAPVYAAAFAVEMAFKPLKIEPPLFRRRIDFFRKARAFDISRAVNELGFAPQVNLREGLRRTADWYTANGYL